jgi:archaellum component FlaF (FlaF/FlaG flagellin family)
VGAAFIASLNSSNVGTVLICSSKLVLAGIITSDEVDSYAEQMLNDNLKVDSMIRQTKLLLKSAQSSTERVAAAAAERMGSVRTASNLGVSTAPAFSGGHTANGAALDIQSALKGTWTMPNIED